jgi:putative ABC transport system permease protein
VPEIESTSAASLALQLYTNPDDGLRRALLVVGTNPAHDDFRLLSPSLRAAIARDDCVAMDRLSRPEFGPRRVGLQTQVSDVAVEIVGLFEMGTGFGADGTVVCNDATFAAICFPRSVDDVTLGLIRLRDGADADDVVRRLRAILPADVSARTREQFLNAEREYWVVKTSVGVIFGLGVIVAVLVGIAIVYQVLSADVAKRMPEFATLKAMGYSRGYLSRVVLVQAATIGLIGFVPGWLISVGLYDVTRREAHLQMTMGIWLPIIVLCLSIGMCCASGLAALKKVHRADPADLFA